MKKSIKKVPHGKRPRKTNHTNLRYLSVFLVMALVVAGMVTVRAVTTTNAHNRGVVAFLGDSNITISSDNLVRALTSDSHTNNSYTPVFISRVGAAIRTPDCLVPNGCTTTNYWQIKLGETLPKIQADIFVSDLGINDTQSLGTATTTGYANYGQKIDWFMSLLPADKKMLWTNLPCAIEPPIRKTGCQAVNTALAYAQYRWPNLIILNWAFAANNHPEYINPAPDVHYTIAGQDAYANFISSALDARMPIPDN